MQGNKSEIVLDGKKREFPEIANDNLLYFGKRIELYFASSIIAAGMTNKHNLKAIFDLEIPVRWIQANEEFFTVKSDMDACNKEIHDKIKAKGRKYVQKLVHGCMSSGEELIAFSKKIHEKFNKELSSEQLGSLLHDYFYKAYNYCTYYNIAFFDKPEMEIAKEIAQKYARTEEESAELYTLISSPSKLTEIDKEQGDFLQLCIDQSQLDKESFMKRVKQHVSNYRWLSLRFYLGDPWTYEDVLKRIESTNQKQSEIFLEKRKEHRKTVEQELEKNMQKMSEEDKALVLQIRDIVFLRTQRADFLQESSFYVQPFLHAIAEKLNLSYEELLYFSPLEIIQALNNNLDLHEELKERKENIVIYHADNYSVISGKKAQEYIEKRPILQRKTEKISQLKGIVACKGKVRGTAKIVMQNKDVEKVNKGDILIASMTTPNLIAAMEKAAAFVTDEGGITCHAAIIAREMKKPCIISTGNATLIFQDGDSIEVDAIEGVVRKL